MTGMRILGVCGNTQRPSRTRTLVETVVTSLATRHGYDADIVDLVEIGRALAAPAGPPVARAIAQVVAAIEAADALIVGSPVYKGSYSGLFKHVFDLVSPGALAGRPVLISATGGGPRHCLMVEHQLRPLFGFFEASTAPTAVYASDADFTGGVPTNPVLLARIATAADQFARLMTPCARAA